MKKKREVIFALWVALGGDQRHKGKVSIEKALGYWRRELTGKS